MLLVFTKKKKKKLMLLDLVCVKLPTVFIPLDAALRMHLTFTHEFSIFSVCS